MIRTSIETINGQQHTAFWYWTEYDLEEVNYGWRKMAGYQAAIWLNKFDELCHIATALAPLPEQLKEEDISLLHRYMAEDIELYYIDGNGGRLYFGDDCFYKYKEEHSYGEHIYCLEEVSLDKAIFKEATDKDGNQLDIAIKPLASPCNKTCKHCVCKDSNPDQSDC